MTTELSQLERTSFRQAALTKAALSLALRSPPSSLELTTAQLCFREASFGTLSGASFSTNRLRGGVLSGQFALSQLALTSLSFRTFGAQVSPTYLRKVLALQLIKIGFEPARRPTHLCDNTVAAPPLPFPGRILSGSNATSLLSRYSCHATLAVV